MAKKKFLFEWRKFFTHELITAQVLQGAKGHIILTFNSIKPFHKAVASEFTTTGSGAGRTCSSLDKTTTPNVLDLTMNAPYVLNETITLSFNTLYKGKTVTQTVDNRITS